MAQLLGEPSFAADGRAEALLWSPRHELCALRERLRSLHQGLKLEELKESPAESPAESSQEAPEAPEASKPCTEVEEEEEEAQPAAQPAVQAVKRGVRGRLSRPPKA